MLIFKNLIPNIKKHFIFMPVQHKKHQILPQLIILNFTHIH